ncbi:MAG: 50S ribosomal protein L24 [Aestuariivita sp.]|nr:50S ribosomal protein L24 [Aestuariivita sp.]
MAAKLKTGDKVIVLAGKYKGKTGQILQVFPAKRKAIVENVNVAVRHTKQSQNNPGGLVEKQMPIDLSNIALLDSNNAATRVGFRFNDNEKKVRYAKTTGDEI